MRDMKNSGFSWIGEIPKSWSMQRVKHGFTRKNEKAMQEDPVILSLARAGVKVRDVSNNEGQIAESYFNYNPVEPGDLLLNPMDLYSGANCSISNVSGVISPAYINLKSKDDINPIFYDYYFKVQYWMMAFFSYGKGVSFDNRWTLNAETLMNYPIVSLPYDEQCRIADYLDEKCSKIDAIIKKQQTVIEKLKAYKLSVITETVTKGLNPDVEMRDSGVEWIGKIPYDWHISKIKNGTSKVGSGKTPKGGAEIYSENGVLFLRSQNIYDEGLKLNDPTYITPEIDEEMSNTRVFPGDVLLNITGGSIGRCCIFPEEIDHANVNQHVSILRVTNTLFTNEYLHYFWISILGKRAIEQYQTGGNREGMSADAIKNTPIPLPSIAEQNEIVKKLDSICQRVENTIIQKTVIIEKIEVYKKSLIFEVITGKKEV